MHISYLNSEHDTAVLDKWKNSTYTGSRTDVFSGCPGYDYISTHLGYRYVMKESSVDFHSDLSDTASLYITIANTGFSSAYTRFDTVLFLTDESTGKSKKIETNIDNRTIAGNDCSTFKTDLDIRSLRKELTPFHCVWKIHTQKILSTLPIRGRKQQDSSCRYSYSSLR